MKPTDRPKNRSIMRKSRCGVKFRAETCYTQAMRDIDAGFARFAKKYGWTTFKNDEVRL